MDVYKVAHGDCTVCGQDIDSVSIYYDNEVEEFLPGSPYWTPMPDDVWAIIAPHVPSPTYRTLFYPDVNKPFCGPVCATKHHQENT